MIILYVPGPRRVNFENFQLFGVRRVRCGNLHIPGPKRVNFEEFQFFGLGTVRFDNLDVLGPRQANFEKFIFFYLEMFFLIILIFPGLDEPILKIFNYLALERLF